MPAVNPVPLRREWWWPTGHGEAVRRRQDWSERHPCPTTSRWLCSRGCRPRRKLGRQLGVPLPLGLVIDGSHGRAGHLRLRLCALLKGQTCGEVHHEVLGWPCTRQQRQTYQAGSQVDNGALCRTRWPGPPPRRLLIVLVPTLGCARESSPSP